MSDVDFPALMEPVARILWGEPSKALSTRLQLRWGSQGSKSVKLDGEGFWHDFETGESGGVLKLIRREIACDDQGAIEWLEEQGFIEKRQEPRVRSERPEPRPDQEQPPETSAGEQVAVKGYHYTTRDGEPLYDVIRYQWKLPNGGFAIDPKTGNPKKTFRQRRPDGRGGWIWNLDGVGHTIYHHPEVEVAIAEGKTVFLPEGEKDADTFAEWGLCGSTNSGGAQHWTPELAALFREADVVIPVDNDQVGIEAGEKKARSLKGIAKRIRVLNFAEHVADFPKKADVTDWKDRFGGDASKLDEILKRLPDYRPRPPRSRFNAVSLKQVGHGFGTKHTWLVQDMIELGGSCALAGFSQSGKSFLTLKLTFAIVLGEKFFDRDVLQGMAVYQLGEGEAGFEKRLEGFMKDRGLESIDGLPLVILPKKINLFTSDDDTDALIAEIKEWSAYHDQPCRMVVIDTYNKATRGMNEISGQDNGKVIDRVERISRETGATVIVIDHLSAGGRIRGHGSKTDDMTNTIRVEKDEKKVDNNGRPIRYMILSKNKDGEAGGRIPFVLRQVVNGFDPKGHPITTCVVDPPDGSQEELEKSGRLPLNQAVILKTLRECIDRHGLPPPSGITVPAGRSVVAWKYFLDDLRRRWQFSATEETEQVKELERVVKDAGRKLQLAGYIDRDNTKGLIWWTGKTDRPLPKPKVSDPAPPLPEDVRGVPF